MARNSKPPRSTTPVSANQGARQLADLATLLGLMQSASRLSQELDTLALEVGGSLEKKSERFGVPFWDVHNYYVDQGLRARKRLNDRKRAKAGKVRSTRKPKRGQ